MAERTEPLTYQRIEEGLRRCMNDAVRLTEESAEAGDRLANADISYKREFAVARVEYRSKGDADGKRYTQDALEDLATIDCMDEYEEFVHAKAAYNAIRQRLSTAERHQDSLRSLMASHRKLTE
jgi:hypothetical protein